MHRVFFSSLALFVICSLSACSETSSGSSASTKTSNSGGTTVEASADPAPIVGKWFFIISQDGFDFKVRHVTIKPAATPGKYDVELQVIDDVMPKMSLVSSEVSNDRVRLNMRDEDTDFVFRGHRNGEEFIGTLTFDEGQCEPARLTATEEEELDLKKIQVAERSTGYREFVKARSGENPLESFGEFWKEFPTSPLALIAHRQVLLTSQPDQYDTKQLSEFHDSYVETARYWGERMVEHVRIECAFLFAVSRLDPQLTSKYLDDADANVSKNVLEANSSKLEVSRHLVNVEQARRDLLGNDESRFAAAKELLSAELKESDPYNPYYLLALADFAKRQGNADEEIEILARLVSLPLMTTMVQQIYAQRGVDLPLPDERLTTLWEKSKGSLGGLDEYLTEAYDKSALSFLESTTLEPIEATGNQTVLVELFTGAGCPPCVAADLATEAVEHVYDKSHVIVLRYHEHNAGPDPLANTFSEARGFGFYRIRGTPFIYVNGELVDESVGGFMQQVSEVYGTVRGAVDAQLSNTTNLSVELEAEAVDGAIEVRANVTGAEEIDPAWRLVLALAESDLHFAASNGIRVHDMIVRWMIGGHEGIEPKDGQLRFKGKIDLANFKAALASYLNSFEKGQQVTFSEKPLDLQPLHLVGFVQNIETKEVLQSAAISVSGKIEYPELSELISTTPNDDDTSSSKRRPAAPPLPTTKQGSEPSGEKQDGPALIPPSPEKTTDEKKPVP